MGPWMVYPSLGSRLIELCLIMAGLLLFVTLLDFETIDNESLSDDDEEF